MAEIKRVERISRITPASYDVGRQLSERRGFADTGGEDAFRQQLEEAVKANRRPGQRADGNRDVVASAPYEVNVTKPTARVFQQISLMMFAMPKFVAFYQNSRDFVFYLSRKT